jgi:hypothetical protein
LPAGDVPLKSRPPGQDSATLSAWLKKLVSPAAADVSGQAWMLHRFLGWPGARRGRPMTRLIGLLVILTMFFSGCAAGAASAPDVGSQPGRAQERPPEGGGGGGY